MAQAVQHLFPEAKFGIGPALENGWYYDIKAGRPLTTGDFAAIDVYKRQVPAVAALYLGRRGIRCKIIKTWW